MTKMVKVLRNALIATALVSASCTTKPQIIKVYITKCDCKAEPMAEKPMKTVNKKTAESTKNRKIDFGEEPWYIDSGIEREPEATAKVEVSEKSWDLDGGFDSVRPLTGADYYFDPGFDSIKPLAEANHMLDDGLDTTKVTEWKMFAGF